MEWKAAALFFCGQFFGGCGSEGKIEDRRGRQVGLLIRLDKP
jgi:hypothetical protein